MSQIILGPLVGGLTSTSANLWGRCDDDGVLYAWLGQQPDLSDAILASHSLQLSPDDGYCGVAPLYDLSPHTPYHSTLTLDNTPPDPAQGPYPEFTTFPNEGQPISFNFAFGSCFCPKDASSGEIFKQIDERRRQDHLSFWLLMGDQIYADDYEFNGIGKIAVTLDEFREVYRYSWSRPVMQKVLANLPSFMIMDDHDIEDDWCWIDHNRNEATIPWWNRIKRRLKKRSLEERQFPRQRVLDALQAYWEHQAMHGLPFINTPQLKKSGQYDFDSAQPGSLAYSFVYGAAAFFVLDTRTMRIKHKGEHFMLGEEQWHALETWLMCVKDTFPVKFIVSSGAILYRFFFDLPADRWSGFPQERDRLLKLLAEKEIEDIYILTGDLHTAHAISANLTSPEGKSIPFWEFCSTPFEQKSDPITRLFYNPFRFGLVSDLKLHFTAAENNFGVVRVTFPENEKPKVMFEVYGEDGRLLGKAGE